MTTKLDIEDNNMGGVLSRTSSHLKSNSIVPRLPILVHATKILLYSGIWSLSQPGLSETVILKNGNVLKGSIAEMSEENLIIDTADMGRITVKRRAIQSIRDGDEGLATQTEQKGGPVNININNSQTNDQKVDQKSDQKVTQNQEVSERNEQQTGVKEDKKRDWQSGVFGRLTLGVGSTSLKFNGKDIKEGPFADFGANGGMHWDILGYRSDSWWSLSLFGESYFIASQGQFNDLKRSASFVGGRADLNFFRKVNSNGGLSQYYFGIALGTADASLENKSGSDSKIKFSGNATGIAFGYDYLSGSRLGFTVGLSAFSAELDKLEVGDKKTSLNLPSIADSKDKLELSGACFFAGLLYNFDI